MEGKRKLDLKCSPGTFQKVAIDEEYRAQVAEQYAGAEDYEEIVFSQAEEDDNLAASDATKSAVGEAGENSAQLLESSEEINFGTEGKKNLWLDAPVRFLLSRYKELRPKIGKSVNLKTKKQMWARISEDLCEKGHMFSAIQVDAKFFSLERHYKRTKLNNTLTGRSRLNCPYYSELDNLLKSKKAIHPEVVLDSETEAQPVEDLRNSDGVESACSSLSVNDNLSYTASTSKRRKTSMEKFLDMSEEHERKKQENDLRLQEMLEKSFKKKEERAERREQLENRKLDLLENLINLLKKIGAYGHFQSAVT